MPKGKAKKQAGTAAAPPAHAPIFTPPDETQHAKYRYLIDIFSRAFQAHAGARPVQELRGLWGLCCELEGSNRRSIGVLADSVLSLITLHDAATNHKAYDLMLLFVKRTLLTANVHLPILHSLTSQQTVTNHTRSCMTLLCLMFGDYSRSADLVAFRLASDVPEEVLPDPVTQSYAAFAPLHWQPRSIEIACRALLTPSRDRALQKSAILYIGLLLYPHQRGQEASSCASTIDFHAVLESPSCMKAIFAVLQHRDHTARALPFLATLIKKAAPCPESSGSAACPGSLSHLLSMGAAKPLAAALHNLSSELEQQRDEVVLNSLLQLFGTIQVASLHDLAVPHADHPADARGAAWPRSLIDAYITAQIKACWVGCIDLNQYRDLTLHPQVSPVMAADTLARNPAVLLILVKFMATSAIDIQKSGIDAVWACSTAMEFTLRLLEATHGSTAFWWLFPHYETGNCVVLAIMETIELQSTELAQHGPQGLCMGDTEGVSENASCFIALLRVAVNLLLQMSKMPGCTAVHILRAELAGTPGIAAAAHALSDCRDDDAHAKSEFIMEGIAAGVRASAVKLGGGGGRESSSSNSSSKHTAATESVQENAAPGCSSISGGSVKAEGSSKVKGAAGRAGGRPDRVCASCGRVGKLKACARCEAVFYCGSECQRSGWAMHRLVCAPEGAVVP